eukprot:CAMPEP_0116149238 /NCGR_PEP_ID=MMETSP0329-20121206/18819_1 /TAXON_ID=697910 /ORGANISM="Pseudo-nitzschia arenysensis, Strain B593" /LENGTH=250 /DNA_ID=CAMNT_0003645495 /DNA_START=106 /DNA_END=858 /DNA_ORIENTATION=-
MASFDAAVFSHAELAYKESEDILMAEAEAEAEAEDAIKLCRPRSKSDVSNGASEAAAPIAPRKRKVASVVSLISLERSSEDGSSVTSDASTGADDIRVIAGCVDSTGMMRLSFPMKLHWMLYECEMTRQVNKRTEDKNADKKRKTSDKTKAGIGIIIGWLSGGTSFMIFDEDRFIKEIMPMYFVGTFEDFKRDLKLWGFTDMPSVRGPPTRRLHHCSHPNFVRDQPSRCRAMQFGTILSKARESERNRPL